MNNLYLSHRSLYAPNIQLLSNPQHAHQSLESLPGLVPFASFAYELFKVKMKKKKYYQKYIYLGQNTSKYCSQIIVVHVHANGFL